MGLKWSKWGLKWYFQQCFKLFLCSDSKIILRLNIKHHIFLRLAKFITTWAGAWYRVGSEILPFLWRFVFSETSFQVFCKTFLNCHFTVQHYISSRWGLYYLLHIWNIFTFKWITLFYSILFCLLKCGC